MTARKSGWSLYWIITDGEEDSFVVARNSRSAVRVEADYSGFNSSDLEAIRVLSIPTRTFSSWHRYRRKHGPELSLPWYADRWLLTKLGARFRERGRIQETLINSVVYSRGDPDAVSPRTIGRRFLEELHSNDELRWPEQDTYLPHHVPLYTILGICLARCHELEFLISHSFILGGMSKHHQQRNDTIQVVVEAWKQMTFGQMVRAMEGSWKIDPLIHLAIKEFVKMRNLLAHGLTMADQYSLEDSWGCDELVRFLALFEVGSRTLREVFRGSFFASLAIGTDIYGNRKSREAYKPSRKEKRQIGIFMRAFEPLMAGSVTT